MIDIIDNKTKLFGDDLKKELRKGSKLNIIASYFSIYAFQQLKEQLSNIEELKFIFPTTTFAEKGVSDKLKKESKEFYIPKRMRENSLYGTEFEIKLRNQLTQKAIA